MSPSPVDRARELLAFAPLVGIPVTVGLFAVLLVQIQGLRNETGDLRDDVAALHQQVVQIRKGVDSVDLRVKTPAMVAAAKKSGAGAAAGAATRTRSGEKKKRPEGASGKKKRSGAKGEGGGERVRSGNPQRRPEDAKAGGKPGKKKKSSKKKGRKGRKKQKR